MILSRTVQNHSALAIFIDNGATPLLTSKNGPEFGISANGWSVFYNKPNAGTPQPWRAIINGTTVTTAPLTSGSVPRLSNLATKDTSATSIKLLYGKGPTLANSEITWIDENNPTVEVVVDSLDEGVRWIDETSFVYTKQTGINTGQLAIYNTNTSSETIITNDPDIKNYSYGWFAPEYNELLVMCIVNDSTLGIYKNNGNAFWDRIAILEAPPSAYPFRFFGSPEPFVVNGKTFVSFVLKTVYTNSSYVDAEVWVMDLEPDINNRFMLRCDNGLPNTKRTDPESYLGTNEVFIYYNVVNANGVFEIWKYSTGISTTVSAVSEKTYSKITMFPNPVKHTLNIQHPDDPQLTYILRNFMGAVIKSGTVVTGRIDVSNLPPGPYVLHLTGEYSQFSVFIKSNN
jgi:hypothetical protein